MLTRPLLFSQRSSPYAKSTCEVHVGVHSKPKMSNKDLISSMTFACKNVSSVKLEHGLSCLYVCEESELRRFLLHYACFVARCADRLRTIVYLAVHGTKSRPRYQVSSDCPRHLAAVLRLSEKEQKKTCNHKMSHVLRKPGYAICEQERRRSACASAQADQRLCCSLPV